jgi:hypothetical protein
VGFGQSPGWRESKESWDSERGGAHSGLLASPSLSLFVFSFVFAVPQRSISLAAQYTTFFFFFFFFFFPNMSTRAKILASRPEFLSCHPSSFIAFTRKRTTPMHFYIF